MASWGDRGALRLEQLPGALTTNIGNLTVRITVSLSSSVADLAPPGFTTQDKLQHSVAMIYTARLPQG